MERNHSAEAESPHCSIALAEELLSTLHREGPLTMDQLLILFPCTTWWQFLEIIESLSRANRVAISSTDDRDYLISVRPRYVV